MAKSKKDKSELDNYERYKLDSDDFNDKRLQNMKDHILFLDRVLDKQHKEYIILNEKIKKIETLLAGTEVGGFCLGVNEQGFVYPVKMLC